MGGGELDLNRALNVDEQENKIAELDKKVTLCTALFHHGDTESTEFLLC
jgi:hypothetical protein